MLKRSVISKHVAAPWSFWLTNRNSKTSGLFLRWGMDATRFRAAEHGGKCCISIDIINAEKKHTP